MSVHTPHRTTVTVRGMTCEHCVRSVTEELGELSGVRSVEVTLSSGSVTILSDQELSGREIADAVTEAGYVLAN
jgi:copper ion binding protein